MAYFEQALSAPELHFKRLRQIEPLLCKGRPAINRTHSTMECEVVWEGCNYLLCLPFKHDIIEYICNIEMTAQDRSRGPLLENRIFSEEIMMFGSLGQKQYLDVILQPLPKGITLKEAVHIYKAEDLLFAIQRMKSRIDKIGFSHKNLTPSNILICDNGVARPLRYWYAKWEIFSNNDISNPIEYIKSHYDYDIDSLRKPLFESEDAEVESSAPTISEGITRLCKGGRYGFKDYDNRQITPYCYSWASNFCEGRAIVKHNGKMGVINTSGKKVISAIYKTITFDVERNLFIAANDKFIHHINYEGDQICKTRIKKSQNVEIED